ncbi:hypothetical protein [Streptomyces sp. NPDC057909]|uniref:hypothetical protein n=1 Tax=Streptomyces sp. NPDC057909 TaxID=3346277 RepID=UPI0036EB0F6C
MSQTTPTNLSWPELLPWLNELDAHQQLGLQRLGGPDLWWLQESPEVTAGRCLSMDDLYDMLGDLLGDDRWAGRPFRMLLPHLPNQTKVDGDFLTDRQRKRLISEKLLSGADLARWSPRALKHLLGLPGYAESDFLGNLVRSAVTSTTCEDTGIRHQGIVDTFRIWFDGLSGRERDVIRRNVCAAHPVSLDALAGEYRTFRNALHKCRNELPQSLQDAVEGDESVKLGIEAVEEDIGSPVSVVELLSQHPWLAEDVDGNEITVLDLLCGLKWPGSIQEGWVFDGDVDRIRRETLNALAMEPGEIMALGSVKRLLSSSGVSVGEDDSRVRRWLVRCGLQASGGQVAAPMSAEKPGATLGATAADFARSGRGEVLAGREDGGAAEQVSYAQPELQKENDLWGALRKFGSLAAEQKLTGHLGTLLRDAELQTGEMGELAQKIRGAFVTDDGEWHLGLGELERAGVREVDVALIREAAPLSESAWQPLQEFRELDHPTSLVERVIALLAESREPIATSEMAVKLSVEEPELYVARTLFAYDRIGISSAGGWYLLDKEEGPSGGKGGEGGGVKAPSVERRPSASGEMVGEAAATSSQEEVSDEEVREDVSEGHSLREMFLRSLRQQVVGILRQTVGPLSTAQIAARVDKKVRLKTVRQELRNDPRFDSAGNDQWVLSGRGRSEAASRPTVSSLVARQRAQQGSVTPSVASTSNVSAGAARKPDGRMLDTIAKVLGQGGHPLSTQTLRQRCGREIGATALKQMLTDDSRFHLSDRDMWALTVWGMPSYKTIKELIADMIDEHGGSVPSYEVIKKLTTDFAVKEGSLRQAMSSPPFTARNGVVRRLIDVEEEARRERAAKSNEGRGDSDVPTAEELVADMGLDF